MGDGGYTGGHTKIFISEDGTIWPEDMPAKPVRPSKRWADDAIRPDTCDSRRKSNHKKHEFRILAAYAHAFRTNTRPARVEAVPTTLVEIIRQSGGVIEWINQDPARLSRFWKFVDEQRRK
jgi:hypothetical protein